MSEDLRWHVAPVAAHHPGPVNLVANGQLGDRFGAPVRHEDGSARTYAIGATVQACSIRIDRPPERHAGLLRHLVQRRAGVDLVETDVHRFRSVERSDYRLT